MNSIVINNFGEASDVFEMVATAIPVPGEEQVLVKVMATSINPIDIHLRKGSMPDLIPSFPAVLHGDVAGVVESVGNKVTRFKKGDRVFGWTGGFSNSGGALADFMLADYRLLAKAPANISFREASAVPLVALTAYEAIFERAKVKPGQKVLIYGGAGGVGHIAVQFARLAGAQVYAVVSNDRDADTVKNLGADFAINYNQQSTESIVEQYTDGLGFDVVFDTVGNTNLTNSFQALKAYGTLVTTIAFAAVDLSPIHLKAANFHVVFLVLPIAYDMPARKEQFGSNLTIISQWIEEQKVRILCDNSEFGFEDIREAHRYAESGKSKGKIVISR